jgi:HK97 family phage major capsid protein
MPIMIDDVINSIEVELEAAVRTRDKSGAEVKYILKAAGDNARSSLNKEEQERVDDLFARRDQAKKDIAGIERKLADARKAKAEELEADEMARETHETGADRPVHDRQQTAIMSVGRNERTYRPDTDRKGVNFLRDVARQALFGDAAASFRLANHMQEMRVDYAEKGYEVRATQSSGTGNFAGLVVPQYLTDMYAPLARAMRPFADICNHHDLPPEGMTVNIPLLTTGQTVALQSSENAVGTSTAPNDTLLTENVQTATGNVQISRQDIDRGTGIDEVVMQDLFRALASNIDSTLINQATTGLAALAQNSAGALTVTPTLPLLYSKILGATSGVEAALLGLALPSHVIMYPYRWYWLTAQMGSTWPLINTMGPQYPWNAGTMDPNAGYDTGPRGMLPSGLKVIVDANVPVNLGVSTNQDIIFVVPADECHLWEDPSAPVYIRAEQPAAANLGVLMVIYEYFAYSFRRYTNAMQSVIGTGSGGLYAPGF